MKATSRVLGVLVALSVMACGSSEGDDPAVGTETQDVATAEDTASSGDTGATEDTGGVGEDAGSEDVATPDDVDSPQDTNEPSDTDGPEDTDGSDGAEDTDAPEDTGGPDEDVAAPDDVGGLEDTGVPEDTEPEVVPGTLVIEDQSLDKPFNTLHVIEAQLPSDVATTGWLKVRYLDADEGEYLAEFSMEKDTPYEDLQVPLDEGVLGNQVLEVEVTYKLGATAPGVDGPLSTTISVSGDFEDPELIVSSQDISPDDFYALTIDKVVIPDRFTVGAYVAIYEDDDGELGSLRGKVKVEPGTHENVAFSATSKFKKAHTLHAVIIQANAGSGSWSSGNPPATTIGGEPVQTAFFADSVAFQPVLEVEDQQLVESDEIVVKLGTMPQEYIGGGWVAIYQDDNGVPGQFIGNLKYNNGTFTDKIVPLDINLEGTNTLHAVMHVGQTWAVAQNEVMLDSNGDEVRVTFLVGAADLSYIIAPPYTTRDPRYVVVERAYSFYKSAWIVLARDDNGAPGTVVARKKVLHKFAGKVIFDGGGDFLFEGDAEEYLTGQPGTFRRCARGEDKLHVLMYEDDPPDGEFTYTPGGTEDVPVLDAGGQPVAALLDVTVASSIDNSQKDSSRYYYPCPLSQHYNNPTTLPVDCRCHVNLVTLDFPECKGIIADFLNMSFGDGPRMATQNFGRFRSGFVQPETNELIALGVWKDNTTVWPENGTTIDVGVVMAIDVETRARRIIGGRYDDPETGIADYGTGPVLSHPFEIQKGPDGKYYIASYGYVNLGSGLTYTVDVIRMDPETGDREYVWRSNHLGFNLDNQENPYGHCANGRTELWGYHSVQIGRKAFTIDDEGNFYFSYAHNGYTDTSDGIGILKVGADGSTCDFVTRTKTGVDNVLYMGVDIGDGPEPQAGPYHGLLAKDGKLYTTTELTDELWEVDIETGDRTALHVNGVDDNNTGSNGTHILWDHHRNLFWQAGFSNAVLLYDPVEDTSEPLWCPENYRDYKGISCMKLGAWGNNGLLLERGLWIHPTNPDYIFVVNGDMIQRADLKAGTSEIYSF